MLRLSNIEPYSNCSFFEYIRCNAQQFQETLSECDFIRNMPRKQEAWSCSSFTLYSLKKYEALVRKNTRLQYIHNNWHSYTVSSAKHPHNLAGGGALSPSKDWGLGDSKSAIVFLKHRIEKTLQSRNHHVELEILV